MYITGMMAVGEKRVTLMTPEGVAQHQPPLALLV